MVQCQRCGCQNESGSRFCVSCGNPLQAPPPVGPAHVAPSGVGQGGTLEHSAAADPTTAWKHVPILSHDRSPPSSGFAFAETAPPLEENVTKPSEAARPGDEAHLPFDPVALGQDLPRALAGFLVSFENDPLGQWWPIHQGRNLLGRQGAASGLDIELAHPTTSSCHAVIYASARPGQLVLEDMGSTNGSFVNGTYVPPGAQQPLHDGDQLRFGLFHATVKIV